MINRSAAFAVLNALLLLAGAIDARERRLPNVLAILLAAASAIAALASGGVDALALNALVAFAICGMLLVLELFWRTRRGVAGQGIGDIKALFSLVLAAPVRGVISYALALIGLAITGIAAHRPALPLLPFLAVAFICLGLLPSFG